MNRLWKVLILIFFIVILDQISKGMIQSTMHLGQIIPVIHGFFNITFAKNTGAAFGMGANSTAFWRQFLFLLIPVLACIWLMKLMWNVRHQKSPILFYAYGMILGGAGGNLIDRFSMGYVVDFFDFYLGETHFATFNVADSAITIAAFLLIIDFLQELKAKKISSKMDHPTN